MVEIFKSVFLGSTRRLDAVKSGSLVTFSYRRYGATDPTPFVLLTSKRWKSKEGKTYFNGINLNNPDMSADTRQTLIREFGSLPVGSVSYKDVQEATDFDPSCCIRTYNVRNVRALHTVGPSNLGSRIK